MSKKDYELIAYCIFTTNTRNTIETAEQEHAVRQRYAKWFSENLSKQNPRFNREKFLSACGVTTE